MAQQVQLGRGGLGKIRSFGVGLLLTVVTFGIYGFCWYYFVNDELKDIGAANDDPSLANSSPAMSVVAILVGGWLLIPPLLSIYNSGQRIRRAQTIAGVAEDHRINPVLAFLLLFPGAILIVRTSCTSGTCRSTRTWRCARQHSPRRSPTPRCPHEPSVRRVDRAVVRHIPNKICSPDCSPAGAAASAQPTRKACFTGLSCSRGDRI